MSRNRRPPGKTAKLHTRHYVVHNYRDHSADTEETAGCTDAPKCRRGGVTTPFPLRLHQVLDQVETDGYADIISWKPHGRCFVIHKPKQFVEEVMPKYFNQTKLTSFQRQLNLYGFQRLTRGCDTNGYYHEYFLRGKVFLTRKMSRTRVKGTMVKGASNPENEPNFYAMPPVGKWSTSAPVSSDDDEEVSVPASQTSCASSNIIMTHKPTRPQQETSQMPLDLAPSLGGHGIVAPAPLSKQFPTVATPQSSSNKILPLPAIDFTNYAVDYSRIRSYESTLNDPLGDLLLNLQQLPPRDSTSTIHADPGPNDGIVGDFLEELMDDPLFHI